MANIKISGLPLAGAASGTQEFEVNDSLTSAKVTGSQISSYVISTIDSSDIGNAGGLVSTANLGDVTNVSTARTNLGLGTAATSNTTAFATAAQGTLATTAVQPNTAPSFSGLTVDGTTLTVNSTTNRVGINKSPSTALDVAGTVSADTVSVTNGVSAASANITGTVTANAFSGDGSALTNLPSSGGIQRVTLPNIPITSTGGLQIATGIPTNAVRIIIMFENVGGNSVNNPLIQVQVGGVTQGASNTYQSASSSGGSSVGSTQGYIIGRTNTEDKIAGIMVLEKMYGNTWAESHAVHKDAGTSPAPSSASGGGVGSFSGPIDGIWLGRAGSLTYSGGSISVAYETV